MYGISSTCSEAHSFRLQDGHLGCVSAGAMHLLLGCSKPNIHLISLWRTRTKYSVISPIPYPFCWTFRSSCAGQDSFPVSDIQHRDANQPKYQPVQLQEQQSIWS